jgi:hypothetical protein
MRFCEPDGEIKQPRAWWRETTNRGAIAIVRVYQRALEQRLNEALEPNASENDLGNVPIEASVKVKRSQRALLARSK